jgi:hypothetical protein
MKEEDDEGRQTCVWHRFMGKCGIHCIKMTMSCGLMPGMVVATCQSTLGKQGQEDQEFQGALGCIARPCLKK